MEREGGQGLSPRKLHHLEVEQKTEKEKPVRMKGNYKSMVSAHNPNKIGRPERHRRGRTG